MPRDALRRALSLHAPGDAARGAAHRRFRRAHPPGKKLDRHRAARAKRDAAFADGTRGDGRCGRRRRRRPLRGARAPARPGRCRSAKAASPTAPSSRRRSSGATSGPPAPSGGEPTATSSSITRPRARDEVYFVTSVPEPAEWLTRESWSAKGDVRRAARGLRRLPRRRARGARRLPRLPQVGDPRARSAARAGARAASCCSATPAIR